MFKSNYLVECCFNQWYHNSNQIRVIKTLYRGIRMIFVNNLKGVYLMYGICK